MRDIRWNLVRVMIFAVVFASTLPALSLLAQEQPTTSEIVYEVSDVSVRPKPIRTPNPEYCDKGRKKKINGIVLLDFIVTAEGRVRDVKVTQSLFPCLDSQAVAAVSTWKFEPAMKDGKPVAVHLKSEVDFHLY